MKSSTSQYKPDSSQEISKIGKIKRRYKINKRRIFSKDYAGSHREKTLRNFRNNLCNL